MNNSDVFGAMEAQYVARHHRHEPRENQCTSALVKHIRAPAHLVCLFYVLLSTLFFFPFNSITFLQRLFRWVLIFLVFEDLGVSF